MEGVKIIPTTGSSVVDCCVVKNNYIQQFCKFVGYNHSRHDDNLKCDTQSITDHSVLTSEIILVLYSMKLYDPFHGINNLIQQKRVKYSIPDTYLLRQHAQFH